MYTTFTTHYICFNIGYLSLRSETEGSWFVQALSEVFLARAHEDSLDEMMNKVSL